ncbi:MAG: hypothetical protein A2Y79_02450 [Deltaproteobacteria bacterium RBG_13_43_22]|nr:MAG: hypothetical protein A2Y79_02450 [Deltaproteobacteria bacterium RBG_13_43_22]
MTPYGFTKVLAMPFETVKDLVVKALEKEGFGILTEIDVREKFKEKLGIDFKKYVILGACNPPYAHKAILAEEDIGLLLPCNVIVYEKDQGTALAIIRPKVAMQMVKNEILGNLAEDVEAKLEKVFSSIV